MEMLRRRHFRALVLERRRAASRDRLVGKHQNAFVEYREGNSPHRSATCITLVADTRSFPRRSMPRTSAPTATQRFCSAIHSSRWPMVRSSSSPTPHCALCVADATVSARATARESPRSSERSKMRRYVRACPTHCAAGILTIYI